MPQFSIACAIIIIVVGVIVLQANYLDCHRATRRGLDPELPRANLRARE
jgi:hypothetical protein